MDYQSIFDPIANVLGVLMKYIYITVAFENYGVAIILFTLLTRLLLLPLNIKQSKSMAKMQRIQPELKELQAKYKYDKEKLNQATMELYKRHQVNPAGGCLPLLVQMPLLFSLYYVIRQPLKFMFRFSPEKIQGIGDHILSVLQATEGKEAEYAEYSKFFYLNGEKFSHMNADLPIIRYFTSLGDRMAAAIAEMTASTGLILDPAHIINMDFLGIKLGETPTISTAKITAEPGIYLPLLLIPIFAALTTYLASKTAQTSPSSGGAGGMGKGMTYLFPGMTMLFTFSLPAGLGLYWIAGNIIQMVQQKFMKKHIDKKEEELKFVEEEKMKNEAQERQKLIEQREFDKDVLRKANVSKKKMKNIMDKEKKQKKS